jgi:glycerol-3-phosphate dehydrogenase
LVGTWHKVYGQGPDTVAMGDDEILGFIEEVNARYPDANLRLDEVGLWNAGLIPFGDKSRGDEDLSFGKRSILMDHQRQHGIAGLVTLIGVRYTMARGDAARAVDIVARGLGNRAPRPATDRIPVHGGKFETFESLVGEVRAEALELDSEVAVAIAHNYGSEFRRVLKYARDDPAQMQRLGATTVIKAEVTHAVREEMAVALADVVWRRTDLATGGDPGNEAVRACAEEMARELGWDREQLQREIDEYERDFPGVGRSRSPEPGRQPMAFRPESVPQGL